METRKKTDRRNSSNLETEESTPRRGRGRPRGSKNRIKGTPPAINIYMVMNQSDQFSPFSATIDTKEYVRTGNVNITVNRSPTMNTSTVLNTPLSLRDGSEQDMIAEALRKQHIVQEQHSASNTGQDTPRSGLSQLIEQLSDHAESSPETDPINMSFQATALEADCDANNKWVVDSVFDSNITTKVLEFSPIKNVIVCQQEKCNEEKNNSRVKQAPAVRRSLRLSCKKPVLFPKESGSNTSMCDVLNESSESSDDSDFVRRVIEEYENMEASRLESNEKIENDSALCMDETECQNEPEMWSNEAQANFNLMTEKVDLTMDGNTSSATKIECTSTVENKSLRSLRNRDNEPLFNSVSNKSDDDTSDSVFVDEIKKSQTVLVTRKENELQVNSKCLSQEEENLMTEKVDLTKSGSTKIRISPTKTGTPIIKRKTLRRSVRNRSNKSSSNLLLRDSDGDTSDSMFANDMGRREIKRKKIPKIRQVKNESFDSSDDESEFVKQVIEERQREEVAGSGEKSSDLQGDLSLSSDIATTLGHSEFQNMSVEKEQDILPNGTEDNSVLQERLNSTAEKVDLSLIGSIEIHDTPVDKQENISLNEISDMSFGAKGTLRESIGPSYMDTSRSGEDHVEHNISKRDTSSDEDLEIMDSQISECNKSLKDSLEDYSRSKLNHKSSYQIKKGKESQRSSETNKSLNKNEPYFKRLDQLTCNEADTFQSNTSTSGRQETQEKHVTNTSSDEFSQLQQSEVDPSRLVSDEDSIKDVQINNSQSEVDSISRAGKVIELINQSHNVMDSSNEESSEDERRVMNKVSILKQTQSNSESSSESEDDLKVLAQKISVHKKQMKSISSDSSEDSEGDVTIPLDRIRSNDQNTSSKFYKSKTNSLNQFAHLRSEARKKSEAPLQFMATRDDSIKEDQINTNSKSEVDSISRAGKVIELINQSHNVMDSSNEESSEDERRVMNKVSILKQTQSNSESSSESEDDLKVLAQKISVHKKQMKSVSSDSSEDSEGDVTIPLDRIRSNDQNTSSKFYKSKTNSLNQFAHLRSEARKKSEAPLQFMATRDDSIKEDHLNTNSQSEVDSISRAGKDIELINLSHNVMDSSNEESSEDESRVMNKVSILKQTQSNSESSSESDDDLKVLAQKISVHKMQIKKSISSDSSEDSEGDATIPLDRIKSNDKNTSSKTNLQFAHLTCPTSYGTDENVLTREVHCSDSSCDSDGSVTIFHPLCQPTHNQTDSSSSSDITEVCEAVPVKSKRKGSTSHLKYVKERAGSIDSSDSSVNTPIMPVVNENSPYLHSSNSSVHSGDVVQNVDMSGKRGSKSRGSEDNSQLLNRTCKEPLKLVNKTAKLCELEVKSMTCGSESVKRIDRTCCNTSRNNNSTSDNTSDSGDKVIREKSFCDEKIELDENRKISDSLSQTLDDGACVRRLITISDCSSDQDSFTYNKKCHSKSNKCSEKFEFHVRKAKEVVVGNKSVNGVGKMTLDDEINTEIHVFSTKFLKNRKVNLFNEKQGKEFRNHLDYRNTLKVSEHIKDKSKILDDTARDILTDSSEEVFKSSPKRRKFENKMLDSNVVQKKKKVNEHETDMPKVNDCTVAEKRNKKNLRMRSKSEDIRTVDDISEGNPFTHKKECYSSNKNDNITMEEENIVKVGVHKNNKSKKGETENNLHDIILSNHKNESYSNTKCESTVEEENTAGVHKKKKRKSKCNGENKYTDMNNDTCSISLSNHKSNTNCESTIEEENVHKSKKKKKLREEECTEKMDDTDRIGLNHNKNELCISNKNCGSTMDDENVAGAHKRKKKKKKLKKNDESTEMKAGLCSIGLNNYKKDMLKRYNKELYSNTNYEHTIQEENVSDFHKKKKKKLKKVDENVYTETENNACAISSQKKKLNSGSNYSTSSTLGEVPNAGAYKEKKKIEDHPVDQDVNEELEEIQSESMLPSSRKRQKVVDGDAESSSKTMTIKKQKTSAKIKSKKKKKENKTKQKSQSLKKSQSSTTKFNVVNIDDTSSSPAKNFKQDRLYKNRSDRVPYNDYRIQKEKLLTKKKTRVSC